MGSARHLNILLSLAVVAAATVGCAHTLRIRLVDAGSEQPLAGVETSWREDKIDLLLGAYHNGPTNLQPSTGEGIVTVGKVHPRWVGRFEFTAPGYTQRYGMYSRGGLALGTKTNANIRGERFVLEGPVTTAASSNGTFTVPMSRR